jgi:hypothetical protein
MHLTKHQYKKNKYIQKIFPTQKMREIIKATCKNLYQTLTHVVPRSCFKREPLQLYSSYMVIILYLPGPPSENQTAVPPPTAKRTAGTIEKIKCLNHTFRIFF